MGYYSGGKSKHEIHLKNVTCIFTKSLVNVAMIMEEVFFVRNLNVLRLVLLDKLQVKVSFILQLYFVIRYGNTTDFRFRSLLHSAVLD